MVVNPGVVVAAIIKELVHSRVTLILLDTALGKLPLHLNRRRIWRKE
jgi:hypothetical protein